MMNDESSGFEVVSRCSGGDFQSISSATSGDGDPYEQRSDILLSKGVVEGLKSKLNFKSEEKIDALREKLKSRDALDAGIADEVANLDDISKNIASKQLAKVAENAKEYVSKVKQLALEKKTTVKRALDILELTLPVFIAACDLSKKDTKLSDEFAILEEEYEETKQEIMRYQIELEMEKREEAIKHGKALLKRTISAASEDHQNIVDQISKEAENENINGFSRAQNDVQLIIGTERDELDAWLLSCKGDYANIVSAVKEQIERHEEATKKFTSRLKTLDVHLEANKGRQADLMRQLEELKKDEEKLRNNKMFESQVQERAESINNDVLQDLELLREKIENIQDNASTAQEIMLNMELCSELLFGNAFEMQRMRDSKLRELQLESLVRKRSALSSAVVEFKTQVRTAEENVTEYQEQSESIRKEIELAAKRGQSLKVTKKKRDLEEYYAEIEKEKKVIKDMGGECEELVERLAKVDDQLQEFGVFNPSVDSLLDQSIATMRLDSIRSIP